MTPPSYRPSGPADGAKPVEEHPTDLGNAQRLVRTRGKNLRFCERLGGWLVWDGTLWVRDQVRAVEVAAQRTVMGMYHEAIALEYDRRVALVKWATKSESEARLRAMVNLACTDPSIVAHPEDFDRNPWLFNVANGVLDLRTGRLRPHCRQDLISKIASVEYDQDAKAPTWDRFLGEVLEPCVAAYLQRAVGLSMIGEVREHVLFFLYGSGANGKSTFFRTIQNLFGDYGKQGDPELLLARRGEAHPTGVADLFSSRLVVTTEVEDGRRMAEALVKQLTGGDRVKARLMHRDFFEFNPTWTIFMAANHKPAIRGTDEGIWRRIRLIPFEFLIPPEDQDPDLLGKLKNEIPGILNWALAGVREYLVSGLNEPNSVLAATQAYRVENDALGAFLAEETEESPDLRVEATELYGRFREWCDRSGERVVSQRVFGECLSKRGYERGKHPDNRRSTYFGLDLLYRSSEGDRRGSPGFPMNTPSYGKDPAKASEGFGGRGAVA